MEYEARIPPCIYVTVLDMVRAEASSLVGFHFPPIITQRGQVLPLAIH